MHTITFKCIGATNDSQPLKTSKGAVAEKEEVRLAPEPDNLYDAKAIAFQCFLNGRWHHVDYVVQEALQEVHDALTTGKIKKVKFAWVKYNIVKWTATGPGYYGRHHHITKCGQWSQSTCRSASTI